MTTGYAAMLHTLFRARRAGVVLDLSRVTRALHALGRPDRRLPCVVHIGGTNGKGSTAAFVDAIARAAGHRVGLFTSPHLARFTERFRICGRDADPAAVVSAYERVERARVESLTFFEHATLMAVCAFAETGVDLAILEVGLGGRLDATNAVRADIACVTGVSFDHQDWLGPTLAHIAREKAGIFKPGKRAVIGRAGEPEGVPMLVEHARRAGVAELTVVTRAVSGDRRLGLAGIHQRDNAASALAIVEYLCSLGIAGLSESAIARGLEAAHMPGRMETLAGSPRIVLDGAHNPHASRMLARAMASWPAPRALVFGVSADKPARAMAACLRAVVDDWVLTRARTSRALALDELAASVRPVIAPGARLHVRDTVPGALECARERAGNTGTVVVAGSLFVVAEGRCALLGHQADPVTLSDPLEMPVRGETTQP